MRQDIGSLRFDRSELRNDEVSDILFRIGEDIERLKDEIESSSSRCDSAVARPLSKNGMLHLAESLLSERRVRSGIFENLHLGEAQWDIILDLYVHHCRSISPSVSSVCVGSGAPHTTALRHLALLIEMGAAVREPNPEDARAALIQLAPTYIEKVERYLARVHEGRSRIS